MPIIYKTTNVINGHTYVGQSLNDDPSYKGGGKISQNAFKKYGRQNFKKEVIEYCEENVLDEKEIYYIKLLNPIYNIEPGGQRKGKPRSKETGLAISKSMKGKTPWNKGKTGIYSKETLAKMSKTKSEAQQGINNSFYGKTHSQETKNRISLQRKNEILNRDETGKFIPGKRQKRTSNENNRNK
jgi:group I intron endonuclease